MAAEKYLGTAKFRQTKFRTKKVSKFYEKLHTISNIWLLITGLEKFRIFGSIVSRVLELHRLFLSHSENNLS